MAKNLKISLNLENKRKYLEIQKIRQSKLIHSFAQNSGGVSPKGFIFNYATSKLLKSDKLHPKTAIMFSSVLENLQTAYWYERLMNETFGIEISEMKGKIIGFETYNYLCGNNQISITYPKLELGKYNPYQFYENSRKSQFRSLKQLS